MQNERDAVLITGGAGFIGSHLVERLCEEGYEVRILDNFSSGSRKNLENSAFTATVYEGSILDKDLLARAAEGCKCIFHLAAVVSVPKSIEEPLHVHEINASGTLNVLEAARKTSARVIFSSSAAVYGSVSCAIQSEEEPLEPISPYGVQKLVGEMYLRSYHQVHGLEGFALRYFNVYGPRQDPGNPYSGVISIFRKKAQQGEPITIFGDGLQTRDYIHVNDVVQANILAMSAPGADGAGINIGTGRATNLNLVATSILGLSDTRPPIRYEPPRSGDIRHSCAHTERARIRLGFKASVDIEEGLQAVS